jgi:hypothetical protein
MPRPPMYRERGGPQNGIGLRWRVPAEGPPLPPSLIFRTLKKDNNQPMQTTAQYVDPVEPSYPEKLLAVLARPDLPKVVGVHWVARQLERPWEEIRSNIRASTKVAEGLRDLGWEYRSQTGCKARSVFERCGKSEPRPQAEPAGGSSGAAKAQGRARKFGSGSSALAAGQAKRQVRPEGA